MMIKDIKANNWTNASEVTTLIAGDGISITEDSNGNPLISTTQEKIIAPYINGFVAITSNQSAYTLPTGITAAKFTLVGGGGGGGNATAQYAYSASGGGAGATTIVYLTDISGPIDIVIGIGGNGATDGTDTSITINNNSYTAYGGKQGNTVFIPDNTQSYGWVAAGGAGGQAFVSQISNNVGSFSGNNGTDGWVFGNNGITLLMFSGEGGSSIFGGAGCGILTGIYISPLNGNGINGANASANSGSGGSGAVSVPGQSNTGGVGGNGICIIEY